MWFTKHSWKRVLELFHNYKQRSLRTYFSHRQKHFLTGRVNLLWQVVKQLDDQYWKTILCFHQIVSPDITRPLAAPEHNRRLETFQLRHTSNVTAYFGNVLRAFARAILRVMPTWGLEENHNLIVDYTPVWWGKHRIWKNIV